MGATLQWRGFQDRPVRVGSQHVRFGGGRSAASGYLAHSSRVGPGILLLADPASGIDEMIELADALCTEGFTALVPLNGDTLGPEVLDAAVDFLVDNWHPRCGLIAFGRSCPSGKALVERRSLDGLSLHRSPERLRESEAWSRCVDHLHAALS